MKPHPLRDVIIAFADGIIIQRSIYIADNYSDKNAVPEIDWFDDDDTPNFDTMFLWRVKPEKKVGWYRISKQHNTDSGRDFPMLHCAGAFYPDSTEFTKDKVEDITRTDKDFIEWLDEWREVGL